MDRNRDARRASIASSNGFNRRRSRTNSLRDSPDEDGGMELQESVRLRDRVKRDRDRERERERGRERERSSRSRRRRGDESSDESFHFGEDDDDEENAGGGVRPVTQAVVSGHISNHLHNHSSSFSQQQHNSNSTSSTVSSNHHLQRRIIVPSDPVKISRPPPVWKSGDEMISAAVPRKARSASTKRSHDWMSTSSNNVGGGTPSVGGSPARETPTPPPHPPMSPTSSNASIRKKLKLTANNSGQKLKPPKAAAVTKASSNSSNPEELEIEIAEVLYGLKTHPQAPSSKKEESREINRLSSDGKSRNSSPISNSSSANAPLSAVAPRRKKPRQTPENSSYGERICSIPAKSEPDQTPTTEKILGSAAENGLEIVRNSVDPQAPAQIDPPHVPAAEETRESTDFIAKEEVSSPKERKSPVLRAEVIPKIDSPAVATSSTELDKRKEEKLEIDLMAPPPQVRTDLTDSVVDKKTVVSTDNLKQEDEENKVKAAGEEVESNKAIEKERKVDLHIDLEKSERDGGDGVNVAGNGNKPQSLTQKQQQPLPEKYGHSASSLPLPMSMGSWPGGLPPMGYMQGVVSMEGGAAAAVPGHIPPVFSQPRPKRCATHCHIARNIHYLQQFMKVNPFWPAPATSAPLFGSKPSNLNVVPGPDNASVRVANSTQDKSPSIANIPNHVTKEKASQLASTPDSAQRKPQILIQQALPPIAPSNMLGPAFIFPLNQQQPAASRPSGVKSPANATISSTTSGSAVTSSSPAAAVSFNYPNMAPNETQYLAIVQNNGYSFPIPAAAVGAPPNYRGNPAQAMPLFNGPFYPSQMIHPSQLQHAQPPSMQPQLLQPYQNASASSGSSASQKHLQSQQNLSSHKTQPSQQKSQPSQQSHGQYVQQSRPRHHEGEPGREDSPSTTDSRGSRASMNIYGQSFATVHPQNFSLMTHPAALASPGAATSASSNHADKKGHQPQQQGSSKTGPDSLPAHSFAMNFGTMNGAANIQIMTAAAAQIKNGRVSDDGKSGGVDSSATEDERKSSSSTGKALGGGGAQSLAFTRPDLTVGSRSMTTSTVGAMNVQNADNIQAQFQQQMQQQFMKQRQQQIIAATKGAVNSNGGMYSEHLNSSSSKFPNALSGLPQNLVQSNSSSPSQSPQWRASGRTSTSTPQTASSTAMTLKNLPQQQSRTMHTQISFGGNQKPSAAHPTNNQTTSSVGSPTISSVSKGASGSPRTTSSASTNNKTGQASSLPAQASKNSPSILGSVQKSQSQQQMPKAMQQQLFFSNLYAQSQTQSGKTSTTPGASGYYMARKQMEQQQQQSPGVLATLGGSNTNDPATAIAAATANVKSGGLIHASQFAGQPVLPAGFSYAHPVPAAVQVKPAEQKQPAGNDNLHPWQSEKK